MVSYDLKYQNLSSFLITEIVISCSASTKFKLCGDRKWIGELDIIMQLSTSHHHAKCQSTIQKGSKKHGKQLNFMYHFMLEHTRGLVRPASLSFARTRLNFWYQSKFRMTVTVWNWSVKTVLLGDLQTWLEPWVSEDAWWLSNPHQVALASNYKCKKCQFHWTVFIKTQQSLS